MDKEVVLNSYDMPKFLPYHYMILVSNKFKPHDYINLAMKHSYVLKDWAYIDLNYKSQLIVIRVINAY